MTNVGFRIYTEINRVSKDLIDQFRGLPVANIADNMNRSFCIGGNIKSFNNAPLLGSAFTVETRPGDNLLLNKAIDLALPGDVIVVEGHGDLNNALIGDLMVTWAQRRGIAGFVIDGAIRDSNDISNMDIPVYAPGTTPAGPYKDGPGEINTIISCGGVSVSPGDIVVGDSDGIVVVSKEEAQNILEASYKTKEKEDKILSDINNGNWNREWFDKHLHEKGCEYI